MREQPASTFASGFDGSRCVLAARFRHARFAMTAAPLQERLTVIAHAIRLAGRDSTVGVCHAARYDEAEPLLLRVRLGAETPLMPL